MSDSAIEASIAPWLAVSDGAQAVEYYKNAFGAVEAYRLDGDEGRIAVAQLQCGDHARVAVTPVSGVSTCGALGHSRIVQP